MDVEINNDMTEAVMENLQNKLRIQRRIEECEGDLLSAVFGERKADRFYGTVIDESVLKMVEYANLQLDIIGTQEDFEIEKFVEPNPRCREAVVAVTIHDGINYFYGKVFRAFSKIAERADSLMILSREDRSTRFVFSFNNLWADSREMTDAEIEEEKNNLMEGIDYDEIVGC